MATSLGIRTGGLSTQSFSWLAKKHHLSENEVRDLDNRYKVSDLDRSGQLDKNELKQLLKVTIASAASEAGLQKFLDAQWHNVDRDGNGTVDFDEFLSLYAVLKEESHRARKGPAAAKSAAPAQGQATSASASTGATQASAQKGSAQAKGLGVQKQRKPKTKGAKKPAKRQRTFTPKSDLTQQNYITNEIVWSAIRNHHSFLKVRDGAVLSGERGNLRNVHSRSSSGLVNDKTADISAATEGGITLRLNAPSSRRRNQPGRAYTNTRFASDNRNVAKQLRNQLKGYRPGLTGVALARMTRVKASSATAGATSGSRRTQRTRGRRAANQPAASSNAAASQPAVAQTSAQ